MSDRRVPRFPEQSAREQLQEALQSSLDGNCPAQWVWRDAAHRVLDEPELTATPEFLEALDGLRAEVDCTSPPLHPDSVLVRLLAAPRPKPETRGLHDVQVDLLENGIRIQEKCRERIAEVSSALAKAVEQSAVRGNRISELEAELSRVQEEWTGIGREKAARIADLEDKLSTCEGQNEALERSCHELEAEVERLKEVRTVLNGEARGLRERVLEAEAEVERLRERCGKFKWQVRDTCRRAERAEHQLESRAAPTGELAEALAELREYAGENIPAEVGDFETLLQRMSLGRILDRVLAAPVPRAMTELEAKCCKEVAAVRDLLRENNWTFLAEIGDALIAERHPTPPTRTLSDVETEIRDRFCIPEQAQSLFDERRRLLDETKPG